MTVNKRVLDLYPIGLYPVRPTRRVAGSRTVPSPHTHVRPLPAAADQARKVNRSGATVGQQIGAIVEGRFGHEPHHHGGTHGVAA
jgi:hypothetical protein